MSGFTLLTISLLVNISHAWLAGMFSWTSPCRLFTLSALSLSDTHLITARLAATCYVNALPAFRCAIRLLFYSGP